jgi:peptidoglycan/LPS O-acetylase OafA/YrhL
MQSSPRTRSDHSAVHFPGLNGVRFVACMILVVYHIEVFKHFSGLPSAVAYPFWRVLGPQSLMSFFTLSGFLVTYLLLEEARQAGSIAIHKFYLRRMLRLWPLYYIVLVLGFAAAYGFAERLGFRDAIHQPLGPQLALFTLRVPNLALVIYGVLPFASPLWSVGVEEQFYLIWPPLLRRFARNALAFMMTMIALLVAARLAAQSLGSWLQTVPEPSVALAIAIAFFDTIKLECMALGGVAAYFFQVRAQRPLAFLYHPVAQIGALLFIPVAITFSLKLGALENTVWGAAYALLILNIATNPKSIVKLERPWLDALGQTSYGIYLYHSFAVAGVLMLLLRLQERGLEISALAFDSILYVSAISLTLAISWISYHYYERPFLQLKKRFAVVASRADAVARVRLTTQSSEQLADTAS